MTTTHTDASQSMTSMAAQLRMPYTLTPGQATGIFLAELGKRRLIGSRHGDTIIVPAQDFSGFTGEPASGFVELAAVGRVEAFTVTAEGTLGFILIDGTDVPLLHRLVGFGAELEIGTRVAAVWAEQPTGGVLDLVGFGPADDTDGFAPRAAPSDLAAPFEQIEYTMTLDYQHAYGPYYATLFDAVRTDRRLRGVKCSKCRRTLLPPRAQCDVCFAPTAEWVDVEAVGIVQACSIVHIEFIGQRVKPPYIYAEIVLDGTSTRLIHMIGGVDAEAAKTDVGPGTRVRAVWSERRTGSLADIEHFEVVAGELS
jgi:uncharacterized OB-fold protein